MFWNNDDFDEASFDDKVNQEAFKEIRKEHLRIYSMPIMLKAKQIYDLVSALVETFLDEDDLIYHYREIMLSDASLLCAKIAGAESGDMYTLRMENAVLVKISAKNLLVQTSGLRMLGISEPHYLQLLRDEIEEFRLLFIAWVSSFDKKKDFQDDWGLFY